MTPPRRPTLTLVCFSVTMLVLLNVASAQPTVSPAAGTSGTVLDISGAGFGEAGGKVCLEYEQDGRTRRIKLKVPKLDWGGRTAEQLSPLTLPLGRD